MKKMKKVALVIAICSLLPLFNLQDASAWVGMGGSGTPPPVVSGGGTPSNCESGSAALNCWGWSWIFYEYVGAQGSGGSVSFVPAAEVVNYAENKSPASRAIPGECTSTGEGGGFWHLGGNAKAIGSVTNAYFGDKFWTPNYYAAHPGRHVPAGGAPAAVYYTSLGLFGHARTMKQGTANKHASYQMLRADSELSHTIQSMGGSEAYTAVHTSHTSGDALAQFKLACKADASCSSAYGAQVDAMVDLSQAPEVWGFCYGPNMGSTGATFTGEVNGYVNGAHTANGGVVDVSGQEHVTIKFTHSIHRNNNGPDVALSNNWHTTFDPKSQSFSGSTPFTKNETKQVAADEFTVDAPAEGYSATYCQTLYYDASISSSGVHSQTSTPQYCVSIYAGANKTGNFWPDQKCKVISPSSGDKLLNPVNTCDTGAETNSRSYKITHTHWTGTNLSGVVPASKAAGGDGKHEYSHSAQDLGVGGQCVRSKNPFTMWYFGSDSGLTLKDTGEKDLPSGYTGDNYYWTGKMVKDPSTAHRDCESGSTYTDSSCTTKPTGTQKGSYGWSGIKYDLMKEMKYHYPGCEDGTTTWRDFDKSEKAKTWSTEKDTNLNLDEDKNHVVFPLAGAGLTTKCSTYTVISQYNKSTHTWGKTGNEFNKHSMTACNWVLRYRRFFNFKHKTPVFKADVGIKTEATTKRGSGYILDTSENNGEFTISITYQIDRTNTENVKLVGGENYAVKNYWKVREMITAVDGSNRTYARNGIDPVTGEIKPYGIWHDTAEGYGNFTSTTANSSAVGPKTQTVAGRLYYGQKIKICGNMQYGDRVMELDPENGGSKVISDKYVEAGCITIVRKEANCGNVLDNDEDESYYFSHMKGDNVAKIGAINQTIHMEDYKYTKWKYKPTNPTDEQAIYARPGDNIRYHVEYCMGANYAHSVQVANGYNVGIDTDMTSKGDLAGQIAADTNRVDQQHRDHYLFVNQLSDLKTKSDGSVLTVPKIFQFTKRDASGNIDEEESIKDSNNIGSKNSPGNYINYYGCPTNSIAGLSGAGGTNHLLSYYQIAGRVHKKSDIYSEKLLDEFYNDYELDCDNIARSLDVGRSLSEKLIWTNQRFRNVNDAVYNASKPYEHTAKVRVPYNYVAKPYLTNNSHPTGTVQIGGKMTTTPGIVVYPRKNCAFIKGGFDEGDNTNKCEGKSGYNAANYKTDYDTYATITKPTQVKFEVTVSGPRTGNKVYAQKSIWVRANVKSNLLGTAQETTNNINTGGHRFDSSFVFDVPNDIDPGDQVCIKMTITPADSHNSPDKKYVYGASQKYADREVTSDYDRTFWALRDTNAGLPTGPRYELSTAVALTCSTAVKRPMISVEDSNMYSATGIKTSVVARHNLTYSAAEGKWITGPEYLFGSWSEYGIFGVVRTGDGKGTVSKLGTASGAAFGYPQGSYYAAHNGAHVTYTIQPTIILEYESGPKKGTYKYNWQQIKTTTRQHYIKYVYTTKPDGTHAYIVGEASSSDIYPSTFTGATEAKVNAANVVGAAPENTTICEYSTQTFANTMCEGPDGTTVDKVGANGIGSDAAKVFTENILDRYGSSKMPNTDTTGATIIKAKTSSGTKDYYNFVSDPKVKAKKLEGDNEAAMYKSVSGSAIIGADGAPVNLATLNVLYEDSPIHIGGANISLGISAKSVMVYKADTIVINSDIIANDDEKNGASDFRMPIIIADNVWFTGNPKRIDAIIIAKKELNTCKWNTYNDFMNNIPVVFPKNNPDSVYNINGQDPHKNTNSKAGALRSTMCSNELRFTAPVVVGNHKNSDATKAAKLILNRNYGAGGRGESGADGGGDQYRRAEIFELSPATYLWSYAEMSRYSQAITTYSRELPSRY